ncbi:hypothetical protein [Rheinheimera baltica]|uniref:hypothetical protein n=1 Tax=Rheinheimera baltica TaxID=67576 RepID=UPI00273EEE99|nr:hypothetical protein [Rheinheimera baltica]MDP5188372.1 hypothetical protein [Rheinheimera baltica]
MCSQQLTYQERMLSCVDKSAWKLDDKAWVKARKAQWADLSKKLKASDENRHSLLTPKTISFWKHYFLNCELPSTEGLLTFKNLDINPFFILWFHPDQSEANLRQLMSQLTEAFTNRGGDVREDTANYCLSLFSRCFDGFCQRNALLGDDGVFGGKERLYLRLIIGNNTEGLIPTKWLVTLDAYFFDWFRMFLLNPSAAPDYPHIELIDYYLATAEHFEMTQIDWKFWRQRLALQLVYYFDEIKDQLQQEPEWQRNAQEAVNKIRSAFEHRQLVEILHCEWKFVTEELRTQIISDDLIRLASYYPVYERAMKSIA